MKQPLLQWGVPASRILRDTSSLVAALSKRQAHKEIQNHKFETRNEESFKVQVFSFKRRQKTSRQKKLDQKLLPPKSKEYDKSVVPP
jgi:hypothetical protein